MDASPLYRDERRKRLHARVEELCKYQEGLAKDAMWFLAQDDHLTGEMLDMIRQLKDALVSGVKITRALATSLTD